MNYLKSKVNALRELQSALMPSVLRPQGGAFKGEL
jgi:hypothetical protein